MALFGRSRIVAPVWLQRRTAIDALRMVVLWLVGYAFFVFHGLSFHLTPWSQAFVNGAVKYHYEFFEKARHAAPSDTAVLLFREDNLTALRVSYPVPYQVHADVLTALSLHRPHALFIDFAFIDKRKSDNPEVLKDALCALKEAGTRVFLAVPAGARFDRRTPPVYLQLALESRCVELADATINDSEGVSGVLTYGTGRKLDALLPQGVPCGDAQFLPSAAFAMACPKLAAAVRELPPLEIIWGKGVAQVNRKWMDCDRLGTWESIKRVATKGPLALRLNCPYTPTVSVQQLLATANDPEIGQVLSGKAVFYGADFQLTGDVVRSPVFTDLPGVYLHAMAYDNLAVFGGTRYKRADRSGWLAKLVDGALLAVAVFLLVRFPRKPSQPAQSLAEFKQRLVAGAKWLGVAVVLLYVAFELDGLDLAVWVGLLLYVIYLYRVGRDKGFLLFVVVAAAAVVVSYFFLHLGPRNVIAFLVFFEVVRHLQHMLREHAHRFLHLRNEAAKAGPVGERTGFWRVVEDLFEFYHDRLEEPAGKAEGGRHAGKSA